MLCYAKGLDSFKVCWSSVKRLLHYICVRRNTNSLTLVMLHKYIISQKYSVKQLNYLLIYAHLMLLIFLQQTAKYEKMIT